MKQALVLAITSLFLSSWIPAPVFGQSEAGDLRPLTSAPTEKFAARLGFRDWGPTAVAGTTIVGGNSSARGGLFAVDTVTGRLKWSARPTGLARGGPYVSTKPSISGTTVVVPVGHTLMAFSLATGKELWRGIEAAQNAAVATDSTTAFVAGEDGLFYAFDLKSGQKRWQTEFQKGIGSCTSQPVVRDGTVYVTGSLLVAPADSRRPASYSRHVFALDAATGKERWRYPRTPASGQAANACLTQPVVTADTYYAVEGANLHAVDVASGRARWAPIEVRRPVEGSERAVEIFGLVDAGRVLVGVTFGHLIAFDKTLGKTAWDIPGQYHKSSPSTAVAGRVLYFQGHPGAPPAAEIQGRILYVNGRPVEQAPALPPGKLNALDLDTRQILWSFARPTGEPNWAFGHVTPVDGAVFVDSYQALVKLQ